MSKQSITIIAAGLLACGIAHAASADLAVSATIQPAACSLSMTSGGRVDYGSLSMATVKGYALWNGTHYSLPMRSVNFMVNCSSPVAISLSTTDNRDSSKEAGLPDPELKHALGMSGSRKIGFFEVSLQRMIRFANGQPQGLPNHLIRYANGQWQHKNDNPFNLGQTFETGFAYYDNDLSPVQSNIWIGLLELTPRVAKTTVDQSPSAIQMDGSTTLSMLYP